MSTLFSKIIVGEIPSYKIYEDEHTYAFLDIFPMTDGHILIVPKREIDHFSEVSEPYYSAIFQTAKKLAPALKKATNCQRVCTMFAGFDVPHCHYHLIATNSMDDLRKQAKDTPEDEKKLSEIQQKIISFLEV